MSVASVFVGSRIGISKSDAVSIAVESVPGVALVAALGYLAQVINSHVPQLDPLVAALLLGMGVRFIMGAPDTLYFKLLPGLIFSRAVFIPLGIVLYGQNFNVRALVAVSPLIIVQVMAIVLITFSAIYVLGRSLGFHDRMLYLLGFGSAVCGAAAITVTAPITECDPDDTAVGLVDNTIAVVIGVALISFLARPLLDANGYAALAGSTLMQTGFVKIALTGFTPKLVAFGLAVKSLRIALLIISIPTISYILRRRLYVPWYLVLFLVVGIIFSYAKLAPGVVVAATTAYTWLFTAAIASVGLNAEVHRVSFRLVRPLLLVLVVFAVDVVFFMATHGFIPY